MLKILRNNLQLTLLLILSIIVIWPLFLPGYFFHHDDMQVIRVFEMRVCLEDLQIPCRWSADLGYGFGFPLFNYYSAFPYYIGAILSFIVGYVWAAKALFLIPLIAGGIFVYFLGKELFGKWGGFVSAVLYLFAPYRALDAYVRGAVAESFGMALIPLVLFFSLKLIRQASSKNIAGFSLSLAAFLLSHNIMILLFMPFLVIWILFWLIRGKFKNLKLLIFSFLLGAGLSAFFIFPAFLEKSLVKTESLTSEGFRYWIHFTTLRQLFLDRSWGFGSSIFGTGDTISFQIGWPQWWVVGLAVVVILIGLKKFSREVFKKEEYLIGLLLLFIFLVSIFMTHNKSTFIWQNLPILHYAQFPWRYLGITIFACALLGGFVIAHTNKLKLILVVLISVLTVAFNWAYFKPSDFYYSHDDKFKLSGDSWEYQQQGSIEDYLPKTAKRPFKLSKDQPKIIQGSGDLKNYSKKSNKFSFDANINKKSEIEIPVFEFPNWQVQVDKKNYDHSYNKAGLITLKLQPGQYLITGTFKNTPVRTVSNLISLLSLIILFILFFPKYERTRD